MKRFLSLVLALALAAAAFVGCGESKPGTESGAESTPAPEVKIESEFFLSDYFNEDGFFKDINLADYVTLPDYKNAVIPKAHYIPGETTVQLEIEQLLSNHATKETLTEGVVNIKDDVKAIKSEQGEMKSQISDLRNAPDRKKSQWWDKAIGAVCGAIGMAILGYVLSNVFPVLFK